MTEGDGVAVDNSVLHFPRAVGWEAAVAAIRPVLEGLRPRTRVVGIEDCELQQGHPLLHRTLVTPLAETEIFDVLRQTLLGSFREEEAVR